MKGEREGRMDWVGGERKHCSGPMLTKPACPSQPEFHHHPRTSCLLLDSSMDIWICLHAGRLVWRASDLYIIKISIYVITQLLFKLACFYNSSPASGYHCGAPSVVTCQDSHVNACLCFLFVVLKPRVA